MHIPVVWRVVDETEKGSVSLELWVFWFDDRHTGKIDDNDSLYALEEIKVGSFTWESAYSKLHSPTASPISVTSQPSSKLPVTVSEEYKWFINAVRNLIHSQLKMSGAIPMGDFYICTQDQHEYSEERKTNSPSLQKLTSSMLCCFYNIYMANTNLVFQPNTRRMKIRPITTETLNNRGKKVIIAPTGEAAMIHAEQTILKRWAHFLDIPCSSLITSRQFQPQHSIHNLISKEQYQKQELPKLVVIRLLSGGDHFYYPAKLVFVPSSSKISPIAMAGFSEDLGDRWKREIWNEDIANYWDFSNPDETTANIILDSLSRDNHTGQPNKSLNETLTGISHVGATKSVTSTPDSIENHQAMERTTNSSSMKEPNDTPKQPQDSINSSHMSLADFAMAHFAIPHSDDLIEYPVLSSDMSVNDTSKATATIPEFDIKAQQAQTPIKAVNDTDITTAVNAATNGTTAVGSVATSAYQSPQLTNLDLDPFGMGNGIEVDNMVLDMPDRWGDDGMGDLDNFDFGVTEEDFDFFASTGSAAATDTPIVGNPAMPAVPTAAVSAPAIAPSTMMTDNNTLMDSTLTSNGLVNPENILQEQYNTNTPHFMEGTHMPMEIVQTIAPSTDQEQSNVSKTNMDLSLQNNDISITPLQISMAEHDPFNVQKNASPVTQVVDMHIEQPYQSYPSNASLPQQLLVPPQFAPVAFGKFTYNPPASDKKQKSHKENEPVIPIRKTSEALLRDTISREDESLVKDDAMQLGPTDVTLLIKQDDSDYEMDSSETSSNESSSMEEDDEGRYNFDELSASTSSETLAFETEPEEQILHSLVTVQEKFAAKVTGRAFKPEATKDTKLTQITMDFDSPFARSIAGGTVRPAEIAGSMDNLDDLRALDYLCQQAVMGGYPFSGGIESISSNGFEASEGESAKVIIARRRALLQRFYGDQLPLPATVAVKGPLNVQQYYELSETNQTHLKYGKYQVKKRRPAEPNFDTLQPPNITVGRQDDFLQGSSKLITFWEKLRLEPYSNKKHINYFVVYPQNNCIENTAIQFFKELSSMYETCLLGAHHPGNCSNYVKGLVPVPLLDAADGNETMESRQLRSYFSECSNFGSALQSTVTEDVHIVIYMINPFLHLSSNLDLSRCFNKLIESYNTPEPGTITKTKSRCKLVLQLIPIEHILRSTAFGGCLKSGLKKIAFSVYTKCNTSIMHDSQQKNNCQNIPSTIELFTPPFILSKPNPTLIKYKIKNAVTAFPTILENNAVLHIGYTLSFDKRWMIIVWTDNSGEMIEFMILDKKERNLSLLALFEDAWARTAQIAQRTGFSWTFVIVKMGLMFEEELKAWTACLPAEEKIAIVGLDIESTLHLNPLSGLSLSTSNDVMTLNNDPMTPGTPNMLSASSPTNKNTSAENLDCGQTKALLLNHRIAYSSKREQILLGNVHMNSTAETWMIPLASGYMIHTSPTTENPNNEIYNCDPFLLEVHLVYNQTDHSAYSTLRDIIKTYHALSFINLMPSNNNRLPIHLILVERLSRLLLVINP
ncbi:mediator complex subunit 13 C-terminal-domain-containing protein [Mycotypha africana]|uniref:mediator complex subunit 13 C-terminal-domain-containing protein n=1 Tax=Mycotypha africana TaxID=64632 RepID=UPI0023017D6B|nr:mediator complex subunit 13 C-terminal-domain-containing protein [Mycotypha africana]KAI8982452.1 mediator complex subunit 13 C-terminal-domain-containing protein [Mycotypha africana]